MAEARGGPVLVAGLGNELRGDDGVGIAVARRLLLARVTARITVEEAHGEPLDLIDRLGTLDAALIVDAMRSGAAPGTVRRFDVSNVPLPCALKRARSTHAIALGDAIEIARALDRLPRRVVVYAVEGRLFETGAGLSDAVAIAVPAIARDVLAEATATAVGPRTARPR